MKTILVPIDYSGNSQNAFSYALELARLTNAGIILFHAFYPIVSPPASYNVTDVIQALEEGRAKELEEFAIRTKLELSIEEAASTDRTAAFEGIRIKCAARMGVSDEKILEAIDKYKVDLVIMGMQGGEAISQAMLGSTTITVMQKSRVPVLAIPKGVRFRQFKSIIFAANLSQMPDTVDLHLLCDLTMACDARLQVLHLYKNRQQQAASDTHAALEVLANKLQGINYTISFDLQKDVAAGIQRFIKESRADLLVLIPQKHNFLERLLDRSITGRITAHPLVPLLALPFENVSLHQDAKDKAIVAD